MTAKEPIPKVEIMFEISSPRFSSGKSHENTTWRGIIVKEKNKTSSFVVIGQFLFRNFQDENGPS